MPVIDYRLLYESMLTQKQEMDAQHELLGNEVKRLKSVIAELEENATAQALALKAAKAMQQAETARADANERDAERYRWLRDNLGNTVSHWFCTEGGEELDEQIDHAMRQM